MVNNETNLDTWLKHLPAAYAYHQVITNDAGEPVDYLFLQANPAFEAMTGLKVKSIIGRRVTEVLPGIESDDFDWIGTFGQVALTGESCQTEQYAQPLDRWYSVTAYSDEPGYFAVLFHDITKQKEKEEKLEQMLHQQQQERDLFSAGPVFIIEWCMKENWPVTYVSQNVTSILGYTPEEMTATDFRYAAMLHPEDVGRQAAEVAGYIEKGINEFEQTYRLKTKNGAYRWFLDVSRVTWDEAGLVKNIRGYLLDQTDAKIDKETLAENEKRLDMFFSESMTGFFMMMLDEPVQWDETVDKEKALDYVFAHQRVTRVNQAMLGQYGATEENFINLTPNDFFAHDLEHGRQVWRDFFDNGRWHVDTQEQKFDGTPMRVEGDYICLYDEEGRITGHFGVQVDVTDRKEAEEKLAFQNVVLNTQQELSLDGILVVDEHENVISFNQRFADIWEIPDEIMASQSGDKALEFVLPKLIHPKEFVNRIKSLYENKQEQSYEEVSLVGGRTLDRYSAPMFSQDKLYYGRVWYYRDITQRKQEEEALLASKEQLETLSNNIPEGMVYQLNVDPKGSRRFTYVSAGVEGLQGFTQTEVLNNPNILYEQILADDKQKLVEAEEQAFTTLAPFSCEARIRKPDGEIRWLQYQSALSKKPDDSIVADGIAIDITERKQAEEALKLAMQQAETANQAKSRYLAHMNHEMRTPLNGFLGFVHLMESTRLDGEQQEFMEHMKQSATHLLGIINNVLDMATIEAGQIKLKNRVFLLEEEIETALAPLGSLAGHNNTHLKVTMHEDLPRQVKGDPDRLRQIILNLGSNGVKFTRKGQVHITLACLETTPDYHTLQLVVEDTGTGMTEETLKNLFRPFYQADDGSVPQAKGTGLGLTITKELVELMGGTIQVESTLGKGTRVEVTLKLQKTEGTL